MTPAEVAEDEDLVSLWNVNRGLQISEFEEYSFNSHFLTATDGWSFTLSPPEDPVLRKKLRAAIEPGELIEFRVKGEVQSTGYVDSLDVSTAVNGGVEYRIEGRDRLAQVVDAGIKPKWTIKAGAKLSDTLAAIFAPFGWNASDLLMSDDDDADVIAGVTKKFSISKKGKIKELAKWEMHQREAGEGEGAFAFASRIAQRFGLWIWLSRDGRSIIVGKPDFDSPSIGTIFVRPAGDSFESNTLHGNVKFDLSEQPSALVVRGFTGGGDQERSRGEVWAQNPCVRVRGKFDNEPPGGTKEWPGIRKVDLFPQPTALLAPFERPVFIHVNDTPTIEHMTNVLRRELSLAQRRAVTARYTMPGHGIERDGAFVPWMVDVTVDVDDHAAGLQETMYVISRTFRRSRSGGTSTDLELVRLHSLDF